MIDAAVVLAGGSASRLGGVDKAMLPVRGIPLLHTVLRAVGEVRAVVVGPQRPVPRPVVWTREQPPGGGPVAGLAAGLAALADLPPDAGVALLAADLAGVTAGTVTRLAAAGPDAVLVDATGRVQWLIGLWRLASLRAAVPADPAGAALRRVLGPLAPVLVEALPGECADVDTAADLDRLR